MTELIGWIVKKTGEVRQAKKGDYIEYLGKPVVWEAEYRSLPHDLSKAAEYAKTTL